ncbi:MAG: exosortase [Rhodocyclaceae bacterium]|nr:exosortase [Rhodocyclaceae bacterium]MDZ4216485.1 exosortase [Rhodocyclaceae bacterium]
MTTVPAASLTTAAQRQANAWLRGPAPLIAGWCLLFFPVYRAAWQGEWQDEAHAHAPLIGLIVLALLWRLRARLAVLPAPTFAVPGLGLLLAGLALAVIGDVQEIPALALAAQMPVLAGLLLARHGLPGLRLAWFPLVYLAFMIPLPGILIDALTQPLKEMISLATAQILHAAGYPAAHSGVVLVVGQYQLLIADACSGLHSFMALLALGVLYVHLTPRSGAWHKAALLLAVVPVALAANLLRVVVLALLTFHAGDAAGRQWHEMAGIVMFLVAFAGLLGLDAALAKLRKRSAA